MNTTFLPNISSISSADVMDSISNINEDIIEAVIPPADGNNVIMVDTYKNRGSTFSPQIIIPKIIKKYFKFYLKFGRKYLLQGPRLTIAEKKEYMKEIISFFLSFFIDMGPWMHQN